MKRTLILIPALTLAAGAFAANPFSTKVTDNSIVKDVMVTDEGEVSLARLAQERATAPAVKAFAEEMIKQHSTHVKEMKTLAHAEHIEPKDSVKAEAKNMEVQKDLAMLRMKKGKEFDKAYIDGQVTAHKKVLENLNENLIPNAKNEELKATLTKTAGTVRKHLEKAQSIQRDML